MARSTLSPRIPASCESDRETIAIVCEAAPQFALADSRIIRELSDYLHSTDVYSMEVL